MAEERCCSRSKEGYWRGWSFHMRSERKDSRSRSLIDGIALRKRKPKIGGRKRKKRKRMEKARTDKSKLSLKNVGRHTLDVGV